MKLPDAWIFDIDGTLAKMKGRGPFEWSKVGNDEINESVVRLARALDNNPVNYDMIIIVSGRDGICEKETRQWLDKHRIPYDYFFMRPIGNNESDTIIKTRIYENNIKGKFNVIGVIDDRKKVVRCWRKLGLFVFDVNQTDEEF